MASGNAALIALDWGTSTLRGYLLGRDGEPLDERSAPLGILKVPGGDFLDAFEQTCGDWLGSAPELPAIACGMIGSRQGWLEAPYVSCPAPFDALASRLVNVPTRSARGLRLVPGLSSRDAVGIPDVIRGEETQVFGALAAGGQEGLFILPGTHSKWAWVADGRIDRFSTYLTGELYAVLKEHSILGRLLNHGARHSSSAFQDGLRLAFREPTRLMHRLFSVRALGLFGELSQEDGESYLSGLLIGTEVQSAIGGSRPSAATLVGEQTLCSRYAEVLAAAGIEPRYGGEHPARVGLWRIAVTAGLVEVPT